MIGDILLMLLATPLVFFLGHAIVSAVDERKKKNDDK